VIQIRDGSGVGHGAFIRLPITRNGSPFSHGARGVTGTTPGGRRVPGNRLQRNRRVGRVQKTRRLGG
ncbi:MAG TPA: hypothetical protein VFQ02_04675, partial [Nitrospira sp.]|nr:hypothetical protein [Nitrospira sp.]